MTEPKDDFDEKVRTLQGLADMLKGLNGGGGRSYGKDDEDARLRDAEPLETIPLSVFEGKDVPVRRWVVRGLIPARNVTDISGEGGVGKTLLAMQLAVAVAVNTAVEWIGRRVEGSGPVVYLSCEEEEAEFHRRAKRIAEEAGKSFGDLADLHLIDLTVAPGTDLAGLDHGAIRLTDLFYRVEATVVKLEPKLVILDTRADVYAGNENDRTQVRLFVRALRKLCIRYDTTVVMLSHPSLTGSNTGTGTSGSTAWNNSVRSRLYLKRRRASDGKSEPDRTRRVLTTEKSNYGPDDEVNEVALLMLDGVLFADGLGQKDFDKVALAQAVEKRFLELLAAYEQSGRHVSDAKGKYNAGKLFHEADGRYSSELYNAAMERLFSAGKLRAVQYSSKSRGMTKIVAVEPQEGV